MPQNTGMSDASSSIHCGAKCTGSPKGRKERAGAQKVREEMQARQSQKSDPKKFPPADVAGTPTLKKMSILAFFRALSMDLLKYSFACHNPHLKRRSIMSNYFLNSPISNTVKTGVSTSLFIDSTSPSSFTPSCLIQRFLRSPQRSEKAESSTDCLPCKEGSGKEGTPPKRIQTAAKQGRSVNLRTTATVFYIMDIERETAPKLSYIATVPPKRKSYIWNATHLWAYILDMPYFT